MLSLQVFPAFTYDARTGNLVDETPVTRQAFSGMLVGVAWGIAVAIFVEPLGIGVVSKRRRFTRLAVHSFVDLLAVDRMD